MGLEVGEVMMVVIVMLVFWHEVLRNKGLMVTNSRD